MPEKSRARVIRTPNRGERVSTDLKGRITNFSVSGPSCRVRGENSGVTQKHSSVIVAVQEANHAKRLSVSPL